MLLIGNFGLSLEQSKVQMSLWAILAAPLLMSNDLDTIRPEFREILLNRFVLMSTLLPQWQLKLKNFQRNFECQPGSAWNTGKES